MKSGVRWKSELEVMDSQILAFVHSTLTGFRCVKKRERDGGREREREIDQPSCDRRTSPATILSKNLPRPSWKPATRQRKINNVVNIDRYTGIFSKCLIWFRARFTLRSAQNDEKTWYTIVHVSDAVLPPRCNLLKDHFEMQFNENVHAYWVCV